MPSVDVVLRPAFASEAAELSDLALRSKGHWGYDDAFLAACRDELTVHPAQCDGDRVVVAERGLAVIGFYRLAGGPPTGVLADLFVEPRWIGQGHGTRLLQHALGQAQQLGLDLLTIDSDPYAEAFYLSSGAIRVGEVPSGSIPGRLLPRLELRVRPTSNPPPS